MCPTATTTDIELRQVRAGDTEGVRRLAELDSAPALAAPVLVAVINGEPVAAVSLSDQRIVANPFVETRELVALLRLRAEHLSPDARRRIPRRFRASMNSGWRPFPPVARRGHRWDRHRGRRCSGCARREPRHTAPS